MLWPIVRSVFLICFMVLSDFIFLVLRHTPRITLIRVAQLSNSCGVVRTPLLRGTRGKNDGMTATLLTTSRETLLSLEPALRVEIRGQSHVIPRVTSVLQRGQLGLSKPG